MKNGRLDSRLTARGYKQTMEDEYSTFAPAPAAGSLRLFLTLSHLKGHQIRLCDVSRAFLHAALKGRVVMLPPSEFRARPGKAHVLWGLKKALYGLKVLLKPLETGF